MRALLFVGSLAVAAPAVAQEAGHDMHGMAGMDMSAPAPADVDPPGNAAPPPVPTDHPADAFFSPERMAKARADLAMEGSWTGTALMLDRFEYRAGSGRGGYAWKASGWYGSDLDKLVIATEGEGAFGEAAERAEVRAVWRHAIDPWFNLEAGVRHDFRPDPNRTYAVLGIEGLAPYWIETEAQIFLSNKGDVQLRLGASHGMRLSGPLVLQPAAEVNVALQDVPQLGIGAGVERFELGARLRYEIRPDLAPYVGINWEWDAGGTARALRAAGEGASSVNAVVGLHAFF